MILATDVHYTDNKALAAGLLFPSWDSDVIESVILKEINEIAPYEPGSFYKRELPCLLSLLDGLDVKVDVIIVDGFVSLGSDKKEGLGMHLYNAINHSIPVVGVAKKAFVDTPKECEVFRGGSFKPLFITAVGLPLGEVKELVLNMHGNNRIPTQLRKVDQLCRGIST